MNNLKQIKAAADIVDIISQHVSLKPAGQNFVGLCPFHAEKTASFNVYPKGQNFHCFGCGAHGDVIEFEQKIAGLNFSDAVGSIAQKSGVQIEKVVDQFNDTAYLAMEHQFLINQKLLDELLKTTDLTKQLTIGKRAFTPDSASHFQVCTWPSKNWLSQNIVNYGLQKDDVQGLGLLNKFGGDFFADRVVFPIVNRHGKVAGFSGRRLDDNASSPKYLNSKESSIFKKSNLLFGLHANRKAIKNSGEVILVEGYTDAMRIWEHGIQNCAAVCGTAVTAEHAKTLKKVTEKVLLLFDGDKAGQDGMEKAIGKLEASGLFVRVCTLPDGEDPDSYCEKMGAQRFADYLKANTADAVVWQVSRRIEIAGCSPVNQQPCIDFSRNLLKTTIWKSKVNEWAAEIATKLHVNIEQLLDSETGPSANKSTIGTHTKVFEEDGQYWLRRKKGDPVNLSNFRIIPKFFIPDEKTAVRVCEIHNIDGDHKTARFDGEAFNSVALFRQTVERLGNFIFTGTMAELNGIKQLVFQKFQQCNPISILGWQRKQKFWVWNNGIQVGENLIPFDANGMASANGQSFHLPSAVNNGNSSENDGVDARFLHKKSAIDLDKLVNLLTVAFPENGNGALAAGAFIASCFSDIVHDTLKFYPLVFLFGPPKTGKSSLGRTLTSLYGSAQTPISLHGGTPVGFQRRASKLSNVLLWLDEYKDSLDQKTIELLKSAYDRSGYLRGKYSNDNATHESPINTCLLISGQDLPLADPALISRCILLKFSDSEFDVAQKQAFQALDRESSQGLSSLTGQIVANHDFVQKGFAADFERMQNALKQTMTEKDPKAKWDDRIVKNHAVILTINQMLKMKLGLPNSFMLNLEKAVYHAMMIQHEIESNNDDVAEFWRGVSNLVSSNVLVSGRDFETISGKSMVLKKANRESQSFDFGEDEKILLLRFQTTYDLWAEKRRRVTGKPALSRPSIEQYLKSSPAYLGFCNSYRFKDGPSTSCMAFDLKILGLEVEVNFETKALSF